MSNFLLFLVGYVLVNYVMMAVAAYSHEGECSFEFEPYCTMEDEFALETPRRESAVEGFLVMSTMGILAVALMPVMAVAVMFMPSLAGRKY